MTGTGPRSAPDNDRLSSGTTINHALEFAVAADAYQRVRRGREWMVVQFLIGRSLELALKAFAIQVGATEQHLKFTLRHDLGGCLRYAEENGLIVADGLSHQERTAIATMDGWYDDKLLEYPQNQLYVLSRSSILRGALDRILAAVFITIWGEKRYHFDRNRSETSGLSIHPESLY